MALSDVWEELGKPSSTHNPRLREQDPVHWKTGLVRLKSVALHHASCIPWDIPTSSRTARALHIKELSQASVDYPWQGANEH